VIPDLLVTKLHLPLPPGGGVQRSLLEQRLNAGLAAGRQLVLVSAPPGFGKTTCVAGWIGGLTGWAVAWLSLEAADDEPGRFFSYLTAALQQVDSRLGAELAATLRSGQLPPAEIIAASLINDILQVGRRFLLVLDDFHVIQEHSILQVCERMIATLPWPLHLVLITREDPPLPLARLRAHNRLTELRAADLRFSRSESAQFLNGTLGLGLADGDVAMLTERTEGWVVGLQLAGLSLRDRPEPSRFIAGLSGSHRYILGYLTEEVLGRQPEELRRFLLQTAILERLNGELCNAVTGRTDAYGVLEHLLAGNLFLVPLDDEGHWYRYHQLFAELLREQQRLSAPAETGALHHRASAWYRQAGMPAEAVQHALAAGDNSLALELIELYAVQMLVQGHARTVAGWMQAIPEPYRARSRRASLAFAWMDLMRGNFEAMPAHIARLQTLFVAASPDPALQAEWLALQATLLSGQGRPQDSLALAGQALALADPEDAYLNGLIEMAQAGAYQLLDDYPHALQAFQRIIRHGQAGGNFTLEMLGVSGLLQMALQHGQHQLALQTASRAVERVERLGAFSPICAALYGALGEVYYQRRQFQRFHDCFQRSIRLSTLGGYSDAEIGYGVTCSRWLLSCGNLEAAAREIYKAAALMQIAAPAWVREEVVAQQVRVDLARGRLAAAEAALAGEGFSAGGKFALPDLLPGQPLSFQRRVLYHSALRIVVRRAQTRRDTVWLRPAVALAGELIARARQGQYVTLAVEALLLRAQLHAVGGDATASRGDYLAALELAEPEGFISLFVEEGEPVLGALAALAREGSAPEYLEHILSAGSPADEETRQAALVEALTGRELAVLRLMAEGLKYEEIAAALFISLNTVRTYVKALYGKLEVNNRTRAIVAARQRRLI